MKILDRMKSQAEVAAAKAKEGVEDVQAKRELHQLFADLGHEAFRLHEAHELDHPAVRDYAERIHAVQERLESLHAHE